MKRVHYQEPGKPVLCGSDVPSPSNHHADVKRWAVLTTDRRHVVTCGLCILLLNKHFTYRTAAFAGIETVTITPDTEHEPDDRTDELIEELEQADDPLLDYDLMEKDKRIDEEVNREMNNARD